MINYIWIIENLDWKKDNGLVTTAHWRCTAVDGDFTTSVYGTVGFEGDHPTIPYADLTEADVLEWLYEEMDKDELESNLAARIEALKNPEQESGTPW
jgi:hypothetical protein